MPYGPSSPAHVLGEAGDDGPEHRSGWWENTSKADLRVPERAEVGRVPLLTRQSTRLPRAFSGCESRPGSSPASYTTGQQEDSEAGETNFTPGFVIRDRKFQEPAGKRHPGPLGFVFQGEEVLG